MVSTANALRYIEELPKALKREHFKINRGSLPARFFSLDYVHELALAYDARIAEVISTSDEELDSSSGSLLDTEELQPRATGSGLGHGL